MRHSYALTIICIFIAGCEPVTNGKAVELESVKLEQPNYDFERSLTSCIDFICQQLPIEKRSMSEYSPELISNIGLSQSDSLAEARDKVQAFNKTRISSSTIGSTTDPELSFLGAQMSPGPDKKLAEYDIVVRTFGGYGEARVKDWGARIRCAPVTPTTIWQMKPCSTSSN